MTGLTQSATGSITTALTDVGGLKAFTAAEAMEAAKASQDLRQEASVNPLKMAIDDTKDPVDQAMAKMGFTKVKLEKPAAKDRVNKSASPKAKEDATERKFTEKAEQFQLKTRGDISPKILMLVRRDFKEGKRDAAMKKLEDGFQGRPGLVDEALEFLEEESSGSLKESISEERKNFQKREGKDKVDSDRAMGQGARDLAATRGEGEAAGAYKELFYVIDENVSAHDVSSNTIGKYATIKEKEKHTYELLHTLGALTKNPNIERVHLLQVNRGGRKVQAVRVVLRVSAASIERARNEAARLPDVAAPGG